MRRRFCAAICLLLSVFAVLLSPVTRRAEAAVADSTYIRVGLKSSYEQKEAITIQNTSLEMGYSLDNIYRKDEIFYSSSGFTFEAAAVSFYVLKDCYTSYAAAKTDAAYMQVLYGQTVYPAVTGRGEWKLYGISSPAGYSNGPLGLTLGADSGTLMADNGHRILVRTAKTQFVIDGAAGKSYPQFTAAEESGNTDKILNLGGRSYRGRIEVGRYGGKMLTAVNVLPLEEYLYGVVPSEMPASWAAEALKAQAVCARGYAMLTAGFGSSQKTEKAYILGDTTLHQVYKGYTAEQKSTNAAVDATKGRTVCYGYQTVKTFYFSTSGGSTEAVEDVWNSNIPYLQGVSDLYESSPEKKPWLVSMTKPEISKRLAARGIHLGSILDIRPEIFTRAGRVFSLKVIGSNGTAALEKEKVRTYFGLNSSKFKIVKKGGTPDLIQVKGREKTASVRLRDAYFIDSSYQVKKADNTMDQYIVLSADNRSNFTNREPADEDTYLFAGTGYGHGVGMSQSGARGMAEAGYTYQEILQHYFTGCGVY